MKNSDLDEILKDVKTAFSSKISLGTDNALQAVQTWVSTGSTLLDAAIKNGLPVGRIVDLIGKSATGKSALGFSVLAQTQKLGGVGVLLDSECAADLDFAKKFGVDTDRLIVAVPEAVEDIYDLTKSIVEKLRESLPIEYPITVVADSCSVSPQEEHEKKMIEVSKVGQNARLQRRGLRSLLSFINENHVLFVGINHITANINPYGPKEVSTGGSGWEYFPSVRIKLHKPVKIQNKETNSVVGMQISANITKNRHDFPFREAPILLDFNKGLDDVGALVDYAREVGILGKKGAWIVFKGENYRRDALIQKLQESQQDFNDLKDNCIKVLKSVVVQDVAFESVDE